VGIIVWGLSRSIPWGVGLGLLAAIILTAWFYYGFLTKLDIAENAPKSIAQQTPFSFAIKTASLERTMLFAAVGVTLGILLVLNIQQQGFEGTDLTSIGFSQSVRSFRRISAACPHRRLRPHGEPLVATTASGDASLRIIDNTWRNEWQYDGITMLTYIRETPLSAR